MDQVTAKGGAMFLTSQQMNTPTASSLSRTPTAPWPRVLLPARSRGKKKRRQTRSCGVSLRPRRPAGTRRGGAGRAGRGGAAYALLGRPSVGSSKSSVRQK